MLPRLSMLTAADVLGLLATALAAWFSVPQVVRLARTGNVAGVSAESLAASLVSLTAWTLYGAAHGYAWVVASSVVGVPSTLAALLLALRYGAQLRPTIPVAWGAVLVTATGAAVVVSPSLLDVVLGCSILWYVGPAAVRAWSSTDVSGIAAASWLVLASEGSVFGLYGLVGGVAADRVYGLAAMTGSALVLGRLAVARSGRARDHRATQPA